MTHPCLSSKLILSPSSPCVCVLPSPQTRCHCTPPKPFRCALQNLYSAANNFMDILNLVSNVSFISWLSPKPFLSSKCSHLGWGPLCSQSLAVTLSPGHFSSFRKALDSLSAASSQRCISHLPPWALAFFSSSTDQAPAGPTIPIYPQFDHFLLSLLPGHRSLSRRLLQPPNQPPVSVLAPIFNLSHS